MTKKHPLHNKTNNPLKPVQYRSTLKMYDQLSSHTKVVADIGVTLMTDIAMVSALVLFESGYQNAAGVSTLFAISGFIFNSITDNQVSLDGGKTFGSRASHPIEGGLVKFVAVNIGTILSLAGI